LEAASGRYGPKSRIPLPASHFVSYSSLIIVRSSFWSRSVLLSEPSRTPYDLNFALFGIPIRVSPWFWLAGLLLGRNSAGGPQLLIWMVAFFLGILFHELGHALVMRNQGYFSWITLYCFGGLASCDRSRTNGGYPDSWRQIAIAAAGPLAGFLLAALAIVLVWASGYKVLWIVGVPFGLQVYVVDIALALGQQPQWLRFVNDFLFVTVVYGIFNLLPVYPLDGGQIAREVFLMIFGVEGVRLSLILSMLVALSLAMYGAVKLQDIWLAIFFGFFAYSSFQTLQAYSNNRPWR
jgi:stage IV sporulation protein FB